jgi:hypothetical protein
MATHSRGPNRIPVPPSVLHKQLDMLTASRPLSARSLQTSLRSRPTSARTERTAHTVRAHTVGSADWVAPQDVEDADYVRRELDTFEVHKARQLCGTLTRPMDARQLVVTEADDKDAHHAKMKELLKLTGGRRAGSKANDVVVFDGQHFRQYANPLETGKSKLIVWLADLRALRTHPYTLMLRRRGYTAKDLTEFWFRHSKQNATLTMTNAHTGMKGFITELANDHHMYVDVLSCQRFYDHLNDRKQGTMDFGPAMPKLDLLLTPVDSSTWQSYLEAFCSGAFEMIDDLDYVCTSDFMLILSVLETLVLDEAEVQLHGAAEAGPLASRPPTTLLKMIKIFRGDIATFTQRKPQDRMVTLQQALHCFEPTAAFLKAVTSRVYANAITTFAEAGEKLAHRRKEVERNALLSQMSRMRLPAESVRRAREEASSPDSSY